MDTPGHVDFTGKVTRALRVIDGAVVVVDAVEEIMAQTEILTRQALQERVRPVLFINKIDRLITELQLNEEQIQKKLDHIIGTFNDLIELYAEAHSRRSGKSAPKGQRRLRCSIVRLGLHSQHGKAAGHQIRDLIKPPTKTAMALNSRKPCRSMTLFSKWRSTTYLIPVKHRVTVSVGFGMGNVDSKVGEALASCSDDGPAVMFITNVHADEAGDTLRIRQSVLG